MTATPYLSASVRRGLAKLGHAPTGTLDLTDPDTLAACRYCASVAARKPEPRPASSVNAAKPAT